VIRITGIFISKFIAILISFIFSIVLAKTLSQSDVGIYLTGITLMSAISIFIRSGFDTHLIRINASSLYKFSNYFSLSILSFFPYIFVIILINILYFKDGNIFIYFVIASWCVSHYGISASYLRSLGKTKMASIIEISLLHLLVILSYLYLPIQINLHNSVIIFLYLAILLSFLIMLTLYLKHGDRNFVWKFNYKENFINSFSIMLTNLLDFLVIWLPSFILFSYATSEIAAQFQIAMRVSFLTALPLLIINSITAPIIALYIKKKLNSKLSELLQLSSLFGILLTIILIMFLLTFKDEIFNFFGEKYVVEIYVLMILLTGQFINVLSGTVGLTLALSGNGWVHCKNSAIAIFFSIIIAIFVIPQNFIIGAAFSTSLAIITKNLLGMFYVHKLFGFITMPNRKTFANLKTKRINEILTHRN